MPWVGIGARLELMVRELTPIQEISEDSRPYSIFGQRFITTLIPAASAFSAAASSRPPSCIQITFGSGDSFSASSTTGMMGGAAENLDHVDGAADVGERGDEGPAKQALSDMAGIDRDHVIAALHQIFEREIARPHIDRRGADHRDRFHAVRMPRM